MKNKKLNQKGFTLIELLVTIALMLSILGIAIVSFINISNRRKEQAWEQVKGQIETAAREYFTANEYMFEGLTGTGTISVGTLVYDDYLNIVTDPRSGVAVDECAKINVTKNGNKYTATYDGSLIEKTNGKCINKYLVETAEAGAPSGKEIYRNRNNGEVKQNNDGWFNYNILKTGILTVYTDLKVCINVDAKNGEITNAKIDEYNVEKRTNSEYCATISKDLINEHINLSLENSAGKKWQKTIVVNKDTEPPKIDKLEITSRESWNSEKVKLNLIATDNMSGIDTYKIGSGTNTSIGNNERGTLRWIKNNLAYDFAKPRTYNGSTTSLKMKLTDIAGNESGNYTGNYTFYKNCQDKVADGDWYDTSTRKACATNAGTLQVSQARKQKDAHTGVACGTTTQNLNYTVKACCSDKKVSRTVNKTNFSSCSPACGTNRKRTKTVTKYYVSNIDGSSCGTEDITVTEACPDTSCYATTCTAEKIVSKDSCISSAGNEISAQVLVKCNGKVDYVIMQYYYPGASSKACTGNSSGKAVCTQYPGAATDDNGSTSNCSKTVKSSKDINGAVFNLRGCGVDTVYYRYKVVANGKTIHNYGSYTSFDYSSTNGKSKLCDPERGSNWFN